jgi:hypothetical protein
LSKILRRVSALWISSELSGSLFLTANPLYSEPSLKIFFVPRSFGWRPSCHLVFHTSSACIHTWLTVLEQVFICDHHCVHDAERCGACGSLFGSSLERFDLYMGSTKCGPKVCEVFRFHRCLVVLHCVDDFHCWKLSSMTYSSHNTTVSHRSFSDHSKLHRLSICCLGNRFSWWHW